MSNVSEVVVVEDVPVDVALFSKVVIVSIVVSSMFRTEAGMDTTSTEVIISRIVVMLQTATIAIYKSF